MEFSPVSFEGFEGREGDLRRLMRYASKAPMFYRTDVWTHTQRVLWHVEALAPLAALAYGPDFHVGLARTLALVHDDIEIVTGDKERDAKERETPEERQERYRKENLAMGVLQKRFPRFVNGHHYGILLYLARMKQGIEAQVVKYCDTFDSLGEEMHEVYAGNNHVFVNNRQFATMIIEDVARLRALPEEFPRLRELVALEHPMFHTASMDIDWTDVVARGTPHTVERLHQDYGCIAYNAWKRTIIEHGGLQSLVEQKEF